MKFRAIIGLLVFFSSAGAALLFWPGNELVANSPTPVPANSPAALQAAPTAKPGPGGGTIMETEFGPLEIFPPDNAFNRRIDHLPVHPKSAVWIRSVGIDKNLHNDFGGEWKGRKIGIPYHVVAGNTPGVPVGFRYADESDPELYPLTKDTPIEGGPNAEGDRHAIVIDYHNKRLYELYRAFRQELGWSADSGAVFDLTSNAPRTLYWTSADAAGLPIFPGLLRYEEVFVKKKVTHAVRFTVQKTQKAFIFPARHFASRSSDRNLPPMGMRCRLKADYDISGFAEPVQVILQGLKDYGMILADNGGDWFIQGNVDDRWPVEIIKAMKDVKGRDLEVVYSGTTTR